MATNDRARLSTQEVERLVTAFMHRELLSPELSVGRDDELLAEGLLDSIGVLRLSAFVEEEFQFKMQPADFVIENFQTIAVLAEYICRATHPVGQPPADSAQ